MLEAQRSQQRSLGASANQIRIAGRAETMTGKPGNYALGSIESRAAARAMLEHIRSNREKNAIIEAHRSRPKGFFASAKNCVGRRSNGDDSRCRRQFVKPGDFAIGSLESRVLARMRAEHIRDSRKRIEIISNIPRPQHTLTPGTNSFTPYADLAIRSVQPLARIRRNRQRPPSNGSIERAQSTSPGLHAFVKTRLR
jgi:hypothetical protein